MKKLFSFLFAVVLPLLVFPQTYQPNWESLDKRPVPQWFKDAKFGIFIHWGVYSVPGWSTKGNYAEWYQQGLQTNDTARQKFHKAKFGTRTYYDLADDFKAELFKPEDWAKLFEKSGAKYIVLTSKHHDGFALWPSKEANKTWGFAWNATVIGPKRDLLGDLFKAVRNTSLHAGMYYSLYEWFNPLWENDKNKYVAEHVWPQMKDLINTYQPDVFWTDGDWDAPPETWKSREFLTWLYNESPVKDKVVVNDRWGSGTRFNHAGIYTPEYQPDLDFEDHYWEESRGMGYSYGYNREEDTWDYNSARSLVLQLIDKVSRGGNFLLDIGPDEHGKIPPDHAGAPFTDRGMAVNKREAIYGTSRWKEHSQWSEGSRDYRDRGGDMLLKITVNPDSGYAVKEVFYTYNANTNSLYAVFPNYPDHKKLVLKNITLPSGTIIGFLSTKETVNWQQSREDIIISLPDYNPTIMKAPYAFVVRIENFGRFTVKPAIKIDYSKDEMNPLISFEVPGAETVRYTTDGSEPSLQSNLYTKAFSIGKTSPVKAKAFLEGYLPSATLEEKVQTYAWMNAVKVKNPRPGIAYKYFQPEKNISLTSSFKTAVVSSGLADIISVDNKLRTDKFAFDFNGYIRIAVDGVYTFYTQSDDGSKLFIDDIEVVDNDGDHGTVEKEGKAALKKGYHKLRVLYFDSGGGNALKVEIQPKEGQKEELSPGFLFH